MYRQQKYILDCYVRTDTTKNNIIKRFYLCESNYCLYYSFYLFLSFPFLEIYIYFLYLKFWTNIYIQQGGGFNKNTS